MANTLFIGDAQPVGRGADRTVYPHPNDPTLCIKIANRPIEEIPVADIRDRFYLLLRGGKKHFLDYNFTDVHYARQLEQRGNPEIFQHLPRCYGTVDTDLGPGVVWERILDYDGSRCASLKDYERPLTPEEIGQLWAGLQEFFSWQLSHAVMLREMAYSNTLVRRIDEHQVRLYHIDAIGCADLIPLADYALWFARLRILSKVSRFRRRMVKWLGPPPVGIS